MPHGLRPTVRALLIDEDGCVLLHEWLLGSGVLWITPGGGVEAGESEQGALRRELREEVGYDLVDLPALAWRREVLDPDLVPGFEGMSESYWLVPVTRFEVRGDLSDEQLAAEGMGAFRWWSLAELEEAHGTATFSPRALPELLATVLRDGPAAHPPTIGR